jgi:hypothetical protein
MPKKKKKKQVIEELFTPRHVYEALVICQHGHPQAAILKSIPDSKEGIRLFGEFMVSHVQAGLSSGASLPTCRVCSSPSAEWSIAVIRTEFSDLDAAAAEIDLRADAIDIGREMVAHPEDLAALQARTRARMSGKKPGDLSPWIN